MNIAIDIGHANNTGSRGNGLEEHATTKTIADRLAPILHDAGHTVTIIDFPNMSNSDDLNATIRAANAGNCDGPYDIGISIHCDCAAPGAQGAHICYLSASGKCLAQCIAGPLSKLMPGRAETTVERPI